MKIALITPFNPDATMGRFARLILPHLCRRLEVDVWCPPTSRVMRVPVPVIPFESNLALGDARLDRYDLLVYQMGNDAKHFTRIIDLAQHRPGVHILHDYVMHHIIANYYLDHLRQPIRYVRDMGKYYGPWARAYAEETIIGRNIGMWESDVVADHPFFQPVLLNSLGAVVHSQFHLDAVRKCFAGPSTQINLAVDSPPPPSELTRADLGVPEDRLLMLSTGYISKSKLHDVVIRALHWSPELASRVIFVIVGKDCPVESPKLRAMVRDYKLEDSVRFVGFQPDEFMHAWLEHCDFCINLRRPNTEGASGSVIDQMLHGKATVVIRSGFYAELPEQAVVKAEPDNLGYIHELLLKLASDHAWRARVGGAAKEYAATNFSASRYAERLADFLEDVHARKPIDLLKQRVEFELARLGPTAEALIRPYTDRAIHRLFVTGKPSRPPMGQPSEYD